MRERTITRKIMQSINRMGGYCVKIHGSPYTTAGTPDILASIDGRFVAVEVKLEGKKPTAIQHHTLQTIANSGGIAFVANSAEDFESKLQLSIDTNI